MNDGFVDDGAAPPNHSARRAIRERRAEALRRFIAGDARKRRRGGHDPNDRTHDDGLAAKVGRMRAEAFDALLRDGDDEA